MQSTDYSQDTEETGGFQSGAIRRLALLTLNNTAEPQPPSATANPCTTCGSSVKRRSPSSSSLQEPNPKKQLRSLLLTPPSSSSSAATKIPPPISSTTNSLPVLRRCISDPINSPGTTTAGAPPTNQSPENAKTNVSSSLPPLPWVLRRSISDPMHSPFHLTTTTPPHQSPNSGELGGSESNRGESPSSQRLKRMKNRMRDMIQWWDQVMREGEEEEFEENNNGDCDHNGKMITEDDKFAETHETEEEEAVCVERTGECLAIHFRCPCQKSYQILLSGNNCYYKLM